MDGKSQDERRRGNDSIYRSCHFDQVEFTLMKAIVVSEMIGSFLMRKVNFYLLVLVMVFPKFANANLRALLKGAVRSESKVATAAAKESGTLLRTSDEFITGALIPAAKDLQVSRSLKKELQLNVKRFIKKRGEDLLELGADIADASIEPNTDFSFKKSPSLYYQELTKSPIYRYVYESMCKRFKVDTLTPSVQYLALNGAMVNGIRIANDKLYNIYLIGSKTFAYDELLRLRDLVGCDEQKQKEIDVYATRMKVNLPKSSCEAKQEEADWIDILLGLIAIAIVVAVTYKLIRCFNYLIKKIGALLKSK
jgi:hypothetical protein